MPKRDVSTWADTFGSPILASLKMMLVVLGAFLVGVLVSELFIPSRSAATWRLLLTLCTAWPLILFFIQWKSGTPFVTTFSLHRVSVWLAFSTALAGLALSLTILSLVTYLPGAPPALATELHEVVSKQNRVPLLIAMLAVGPVGEEFLFRGWMLPMWVNRYGSGKAIFGTTIFFALLHLFSWRIIIALLVGVLLGCVAYMAKSVLPAIAAHIGANLASILLEPILGLSGISKAELNEMSSVPIWLPLLAFGVFCLVLLPMNLGVFEKGAKKEVLSSR